MSTAEHNDLAERERQRKLQQQIEDVKWLMNQKQGRRIVWRLLALAGVYQTSFNSSGSVTAFNEGKRNVGLVILADVHEHAPDESLVMLKENREA